VFTYPVKSQLQSVGNRFLRCIPYTAPLRILGNLEATPPALNYLLFQPACIDSQQQVPTIAEFIGRHSQAVGQFSSRSQKHIRLGNGTHRSHSLCCFFQ
jgi:hypothetical protein